MSIRVWVLIVYCLYWVLRELLVDLGLQCYVAGWVLSVDAFGSRLGLHFVAFGVGCG